MNLKSIGLVVVPSLALVAAAGAGLFFGVVQVPSESAVVTRAPAPPATRAQHESASAPATAQSDISGLSATLTAPPPSRDADATGPIFDIARIEPTGDAVIAGRAAPGATVELLCGGKPCGQAVADQEGQFVMIPSRLPAGNYELTLRSTRPNGQQATSERNVTVSLASSPRVQPVAPVTASATASVVPAAPVLPDSLPRPVAMGTPQRDQPAAEGPTSAIAPPRSVTKVVSRGDSLWRISRTTYGDGTRYPIIFRANRTKIRNPNLIFPGQTFVVPARSH